SCRSAPPTQDTSRQFAVTWYGADPDAGRTGAASESVPHSRCRHRTWMPGSRPNTLEGGPFSKTGSLNRGGVAVADVGCARMIQSAFPGPTSGRGSTVNVKPDGGAVLCTARTVAVAVERPNDCPRNQDSAHTWNVYSVPSARSGNVAEEPASDTEQLRS